ncbi:MAG: helix-turn-helix domain-containing protein [Gemmataceae bacterium]
MSATRGETLGQMLRRLRERLGLTPEGLATKAGVPLVSYRNWEYDHRVPGLAAASLLARALGVPLQELADRVEGVEDGRSGPRAARAGGAAEGVRGKGGVAKGREEGRGGTEAGGASRAASKPSRGRKARG